MSAIEATTENFDALITSGKLVLVDFWATWCRPCKMMGPIIDALSDEYEGRAFVTKVNADESKDLCSRFGITNIPNFKFFKNGVEVSNVVGAVPKSTLKSLFDQNL